MLEKIFKSLNKRKQIEALERENRYLSAQFQTRLQEETKKRKDIIRRAKAKIDLLETENANLLAQIYKNATLANTLDTKQREIARLELVFSQEVGENETRQRENEVLREQLASLETDVLFLRQQLSKVPEHKAVMVLSVSLENKVRSRYAKQADKIIEFRKFVKITVTGQKILTKFVDQSEQLKRYLRSLFDQLTLLELDSENKLAKILGTQSAIYEVSLKGCECMDFSKRKSPCKHMYMLYRELGLLKSELSFEDFET
ncbi:hypothetical protein FACS1894217_11810 [Clostridia bacterium]|nr:hypothetical protein FACS1894217_11810 [Clostridia bacterium]